MILMNEIIQIHQIIQMQKITQMQKRVSEGWIIFENPDPWCALCQLKWYEIMKVKGKVISLPQEF